MRDVQAPGERATHEIRLRIYCFALAGPTASMYGDGWGLDNYHGGRGRNEALGGFWGI